MDTPTIRYLAPDSHKLPSKKAKAVGAIKGFFNLLQKPIKRRSTAHDYDLDESNKGKDIVYIDPPQVGREKSVIKTEVIVPKKNIATNNLDDEEMKTTNTTGHWRPFKSWPFSWGSTSGGAAAETEMRQIVATNASNPNGIRDSVDNDELKRSMDTDCVLLDNVTYDRIELDDDNDDVFLEDSYFEDDYIEDYSGSSCDGYVSASGSGVMHRMHGDGCDRDDQHMISSRTGSGGENAICDIEDDVEYDEDIIFLNNFDLENENAGKEYFKVIPDFMTNNVSEQIEVEHCKTGSLHFRRNSAPCQIRDKIESDDFYNEMNCSRQVFSNERHRKSISVSRLFETYPQEQDFDERVVEGASAKSNDHSNQIVSNAVEDLDATKSNSLTFSNDHEATPSPDYDTNSSDEQVCDKEALNTETITVVVNNSQKRPDTWEIVLSDVASGSDSESAKEIQDKRMYNSDSGLKSKYVDESIGKLSQKISASLSALCKKKVPTSVQYYRIVKNNHTRLVHRKKTSVLNKKRESKTSDSLVFNQHFDPGKSDGDYRDRVESGYVTTSSTRSRSSTGSTVVIPSSFPFPPSSPLQSPLSRLHTGTHLSPRSLNTIDGISCPPKSKRARGEASSLNFTKTQGACVKVNKMKRSNPVCTQFSNSPCVAEMTEGSNPVPLASNFFTSPPHKSRSDPTLSRLTSAIKEARLKFTKKKQVKPKQNKTTSIPEREQQHIDNVGALEMKSRYSPMNGQKYLLTNSTQTPIVHKMYPDKWNVLNETHTVVADGLIKPSNTAETCLRIKNTHRDQIKRNTDTDHSVSIVDLKKSLLTTTPKQNKFDFVNATPCSPATVENDLLQPIGSSSPLPNKIPRCPRNYTIGTTPLQNILLETSTCPPQVVYWTKAESPQWLNKTPRKRETAVQNVAHTTGISGGRRKKFTKRRPVKTRLDFNVNDGDCLVSEEVNKTEVQVTPKSTPRCRSKCPRDYVLLKGIAESIVDLCPNYRQVLLFWSDLSSVMEIVNEIYVNMMKEFNALLRRERLASLVDLKAHIIKYAKPLMSRLTIENCIEVVFMSLLANDKERILSSLDFLFHNLPKVSRNHGFFSNLAPEIVTMFLSNKRTIVRNVHGFPLPHRSAEREVFVVVARYLAAVRQSGAFHTDRVKSLFAMVGDARVLSDEIKPREENERPKRDKNCNIVLENKRKPVHPRAPRRQHILDYQTSNLDNEEKERFRFEPFISASIHSLDEIGMDENGNESPYVSLPDICNEDYILRKLYFTFNRYGGIPYVTKIGMQYYFKCDRKTYFITKSASFESQRNAKTSTNVQQDIDGGLIQRNDDTMEINEYQSSSNDMGDRAWPTDQRPRPYGKLGRVGVGLEDGEHITSVHVLGEKAIHNVEIGTNTGRRVRAHNFANAPETKWTAISTPRTNDGRTTGKGQFCLHALFGDVLTKPTAFGGRAFITNLGAMWTTVSYTITV